MALVLMAPTIKTEFFGPFGKAKKENNANYIGAAVNTENNGIDQTTKPSITIISPNGGEIIHGGSSYMISWKTTGLNNKEKVQILLSKMVSSTTTTNTFIATSTPNTGFYKWDIPGNISGGNIFKIVGIIGTAGRDESDNYFSVTRGIGGSLSVQADVSSLSYHMVAAESSDVELGVLKISAPDEAVALKKIGLKMSDEVGKGANLSRTENIVKLTLWDGQKQVGQGIFVGSKNETIYFSDYSVIIPKGGDKKLTIKADLAEINSHSLGQQGAFIEVDYDGLASLEGVGQESGITIKSNSKATSFDGIRMFKSFPTIAKVPVPTTTLSNGPMSIYRFKVSANSTGSVGLYKFTFQVATSTATVTNLNVFAYKDSGFSIPVSGLGVGGKLMSRDMGSFKSKTDINVLIDLNGTPTTLQVPAGETRYFDVTAIISKTNNGSSVSTQLQGDAAYPKLATLMGTYNDIEKEAGGNNNFIWSPNATTSSTITHQDWTNGYFAPGLPPTNLTATVLAR